DGDAAMLEEAARIADLHADISLGIEARIKLIKASNWSGNHELAIAAFTWCVAQLDRDEQLRQRWERKLLWYFKWIVQSLSEYSQVSREQIEKSFDEMSDRFLRIGFGAGAIFKCKAYTSIRLGDMQAFYEARQRWLESPRDSISDCPACQTDSAVEFELHIGEIEKAIAIAEPIIQGHQKCTEIPCLTFGRLLLPLLKLGSSDLAERLHRSVIQQTLSSRDFLCVAGDHCAYLSMVGEFTKSIQVFEIGISWVMTARRTWDRMCFLGNAAILFERLAKQGEGTIQLRIPKDAPFYAGDDNYKPSAVANHLEQMRAELAGELNRRNGNTSMDGRHQSFRDLIAAIPMHQLNG
ncbi:MAG TPA: hypothetical protein VL992_16490, partial [Tepidisphaeraceae bacterium]|nr:hypothetical protein [Tepidisphaeraceae bacterium]